VPKDKTTAQRLVRDDALPSEQELISEIAGQAMEQCCRNAKYRRSMQPPAEFLAYYNHRPHQGAELAGLSPHEYATRMAVI